MQKKYWGKKFFESRLNTALLLVLIVLMVFALRFMYQNKEGYLSSLKNLQAKNKNNLSAELIVPAEVPIGKSSFDDASVPEGIRQLVPKQFVIKKLEKTNLGLHEDTIFIATIGVDPTLCPTPTTSSSTVCQLSTTASYGDKIVIFAETPVGFNLIFPNEGALTADSLSFDGVERYTILHTQNLGNYILWVQSYSGTGTAEVAEVIYTDEVNFVSEYLTEKGLPSNYQFNGYNNFQVEKIKGKEYIVHSLSGYSKEASRCCPDLPSLKIYWSIESGKPEVFKTEKIPLKTE